MSCGKSSSACCPEKQEIKKTKAEHLHHQLRTPDAPLVINVLNKELYDQCHIDGSINIPLAELSAQAQGWNKDVAIVVYCSSAECSASTRAALILINMGFTHVEVYPGGTKEWRELGLPIKGHGCSV